MHVYKRADRVAHRIKLSIADLLAKKVRDPRIGFVTVMAVEVSDDLHLARVFVSVPEGQDTRKTFAGLKAAVGYLRERLACELAMRRVPELIFLPDIETDKVTHLLGLLERIKQDQAGVEDHSAERDSQY